MSAITASSISTDQAKMLAARLIQRSMLKMVAASLCDKVPMEHGAGLTAFFVRYKRMNVPVTTLTEGSDPSSSSFAVDGVNVTLDQWGDLLNVTDVALLATKHDVVRQVLDLLSDNAQRVIDREVQIVWLSGTNILYGDGSISARSSITSTMRLTDQLITQAIVNLSDQGAPPRGGPTGVRVESSGDIRQGSAYAAVAGPHVIGEIRQPGTVLGSWVSVMMYNDAKNLYNAEVGTWLGIRWIESNFVPKFTLFGNTTAAVTSAASFGTGTPTVTVATTGGSLNGTTGGGVTFFYKVTRKDLLRGFEEAISIPHSTATTNATDTNKFTFAMPATAGFVYNVYFDTVATGGTGTDATLGLSASNVAASGSAVVTAVPAATTNPPPNIINDGTVTTVHPIYIHADESCNWVGLQNLEFMQTPDQALPGNLLKLNRWFSYKFMAKTMIRDQTRILRLEVASIYG
jgi:N4-gp56 family major capsid protein